MHRRDLRLGELFKIALGKLALIHSVDNERKGYIRCNDVAASLANDDIGFSGKELLNCKNAHSGCHNSVAQSGCAASDDMSKAGKSRFDSGSCLDSLGELRSVFRANALGNDNDEVSLSYCARILDLLAKRVYNIIWGAAFDPSLDDEMRITIIATGFEGAKKVAAPIISPDIAPKTEEKETQPVVDATASRRQAVAPRDFDDILSIVNNRRNS